ncbi:MAG: C4-dicarboxylate ABC transporter, partial [Polyangiaceae bacterium]
MTVVDRMVARARRLRPGSFALVMATGIVSVDVTQHGMARLGRAFFWLNLVAYAWLLLLSGVRLARYRHEVAAQFATPGRGTAFLTTAAATCVLGTQCLLVVHLPMLARVLAVLGAVFVTVLIYLFFFVTMVRRHKA